MIKLRAIKKGQKHLKNGLKLTYNVRLESTGDLHLNEANISLIQDKFVALAKDLRQRLGVEHYTLTNLYLGFR